MASLANVISELQSGTLSRDAFVAQLDSTLTTADVSATQLLAALDEAHAREPLPADLYNEIQKRIERLPISNRAVAGDETRLITRAEWGASFGGSYAGSGAGMRLPEPPVATPDNIKGIGDTLNNRFVLEECLGVGGMGTVYKALDLRKIEASDRKPYVAIKVLNVQFRGNPKSLIALQREARKAQMLAHRNIVTVYDFDRDGPIVYLTMEYLSGKPLSQILRTADFKGMPYQSAVPIVRGMCGALAYAHERGFVHCDFKPANVFLTDTAEVKVIDFGIARVFQRPEEESDATVFDPGSLGALTPAYASPEMLEHREPDPRDDIYALACITYELLTGRHPFNRVSATQARNDDMKPERPEHLDPRQWRALRSALSFEREARTQSVGRFLEGFETQAPRPVTSFLPSPRARAGLAGLAVVLAAGVGVYTLKSGSGKSEAQATPAASEPVSVADTPASTPGQPQPVAQATPVKPLTLASVLPVLTATPCSALGASVRDGLVQVHGFVGQRYGATQLADALNALPGARHVDLDVETLAEDKCEPVRVLSPYWERNWQTGRNATLRVRPASGQLTDGDPLVVDINTPAFDGYVSLDYYQLDGSVVHMVPGPRVRSNQTPPRYTATIGNGGEWIVSKPFGTEMIVMVMTPAPLFAQPRPESEPRGDYLHALEARLSQLAGQYGQDKVLADVQQIRTKAR